MIAFTHDVAETPSPWGTSSRDLDAFIRAAHVAGVVVMACLRRLGPRILMTRVSVLIPTFRRPEGFLRAARSVFAQVQSGDAELIGVDNSPEGSALTTFHAIAADAPIPFRWDHIAEPGVARARNAALFPGARRTRRLARR
ncbi:MAG: glycosyltransferase [Terricaulis sp.]